MRITDLTFRRVRLKLYEPLRVAFGTLRCCENVLLRLTTEEGLVGYGEAAPMPFVTGETAESVEAALRLLRPALIGQDPHSVEALHQAMDRILHRNPSAKCAVDLALHDLSAKAAGVPVYQLLGGRREQIVNDITLGIEAPEQMAARAKACVEERGYRILKIKAGLDPSADIAAVRLIREAVGPSVRLRVDANQGYTVPQALEVLKALAELGVEAVEQCLPDWDLEGAAYLRSRAGGVRLMLDESIHGFRDAARACRLQAADIFNIKLMKCGGLYPGLQISTLAQAQGLSCMVGCMLETRLAITAGLNLVAARENITEADCDGFLYYDERDAGVSGGFTAEGGTFLLSDAPGFGVTVAF